MRNVKATFAEDQQTYYGQGYRGQKALWKINNNALRNHEHLHPSKWSDPPFEGDNNGWKSEGYRKLNGPTWVGQALAARMMGAREAWQHEAFFDYVDRWVKEAEDGSWDGEKNAPTGYRAFPGDFVAEMWKAYRDKADDIGAETKRRCLAPAGARTR
jgi:hypothetical protein